MENATPESSPRQSPRQARVLVRSFQTPKRVTHCAEFFTIATTVCLLDTAAALPADTKDNKERVAKASTVIARHSVSLRAYPHPSIIISPNVCNINL